MTKFKLENVEDLDQAVCETLGYASICWENLEDTGVFRSTDALHAARELTKWINERYEVKVARLNTPPWWQVIPTPPHPYITWTSSKTSTNPDPKEYDDE